MSPCVIRRRINELGERHRIEIIAIDRWNATQLVTQLESEGFPIQAFGQGFASMTWPSKKLEEVVRSGRMIHGGIVITNHANPSRQLHGLASSVTAGWVEVKPCLLARSVLCDRFCNRMFIVGTTQLIARISAH